MQDNEFGLTNGRGLESQVSLEVLSNLTNETLEGKLSDEKLGRLHAGGTAKAIAGS